MEARADMKSNILKSSVILPTAIGVIAGGLMFALGMAADAPGMSLIGLIVAFLLFVLSARNSGIVPKGYLLYVVFMCFGLGAVLLSVGWFVDSEFDNTPQFPISALCLGVVLLCVGLLGLRKVRRKA
jgi:hypothetical protein